MGNKIYQVFSPDGFSISQDTYSTPEEQKEAFNKWKKRYQNQGYYSSNNGRIPLDYLEQYCTFKEFETSNLNDINLYYNPS
ncbi:hypothetical protein [Aquimarina longa]|uniref:hypothetical protein n=1 Tax=Aquimarina longa TaxID=1080221 RepID=UPI000785EB2D|nr:hypothetical protein [Aquimarina longa]